MSDKPQMTLERLEYLKQRGIEECSFDEWDELLEVATECALRATVPQAHEQIGELRELLADERAADPAPAEGAPQGIFYGKDCPKGMVQVEYVGCNPSERYSKYGWKPCQQAFIEVYVDGERFRIEVGDFNDGKPRRGLHVIGPIMTVEQTSLNAGSIFKSAALETPAPEGREPLTWRVGGKVPLNVYEGDRPMFQCHTPEEAARIVALLNRAPGAAPAPARDACEICQGLHGGVPGNENVVNGVTLCDYCHATFLKFEKRRAPAPAPVTPKELRDAAHELEEWANHATTDPGYMRRRRHTTALRALADYLESRR